MAIIELKLDISGSMLDVEKRIQSALNEAEVVLTQETLKRFDTDGSPILTGPIKWTSKAAKEQVDGAITYFRNHWQQMNYHFYQC